MTNGEFTQTLSRLVQLDIDAVYAYDEAIKRIDVDAVRRQLRTFQEDHERHIADLSSYLEAIGEKPPARVRDRNGSLREGLLALRSTSGIVAALRAVQWNAEATAEQYRQALATKFPTQARRIVELNYNDEQRHLTYVGETLAHRARERAA